MGKKELTCLPQLSAPVLGWTHSSYLNPLRRSPDPFSRTRISHDASLDSIGDFDSKLSQFSSLRFVHLVLHGGDSVTFRADLF